MSNYSLSIPAITGEDTVIEFPNGGVTVFVGANGSGKTRLGFYIDKSLPKGVHRIPAHKNLQFTDVSNPTNLEHALNALLYGHKDKPAEQKFIHRWGQKNGTMLLSDYDKLLSVLFSEHYEQSTQYLTASKSSPDVLRPEPLIEKVQSIWGKVLPHRELHIKSCKIEVSDKTGGSVYSASELSDGERAIFYLIGQCLLAPLDGIIILDEPELHIHKAIVKTLWDEIEVARPDCAFVYITHDLDFAKSRAASQKFVVKDYQNDKWSIQVIPEDSGFPEEVVSKILGSRNPILFVEGTGDSTDTNLYGKVYPDYTVVPIGACEDVIHAVATFKRNADLHHVNCAGIIDQDDRDEAKVQELASMGIYSLPVTEVENILIFEDVLRIVGKDLNYEDVELGVKIQEIKDKAFEQATGDFETYSIRYTKRRIDGLLKHVDFIARDISTFENAFSTEIQKIDPKALYEERVRLMKKIIADQDYAALIKLYDNKGISKQIGGFFGLRPNGYPEHVLRLLKSTNDNELVVKLRELLPDITGSVSSATSDSLAAE